MQRYFLNCFHILSSPLVLLLILPELLPVVSSSRTDTGVDRGARAALHLVKHTPVRCITLGHMLACHWGKLHHNNTAASASFSKAELWLMETENYDTQSEILHGIYLLASSFFRHDLKEVMRSIDLYPWTDN